MSSLYLFVVINVPVKYYWIFVGLCNNVLCLNSAISLHQSPFLSGFANISDYILFK